MNTTFLMLIAVSFLMAGVAAYMVRDKFRELGTLKGIIAIPIMALPGILLTAIIFGVSYGSAVHDIEIWNGQVVNKSRVHDSYIRTYQCNCRQVCSGSGSSRSCTTQCDTCSEQRYTVAWNCNTTVGSFEIYSLDSTSRSVYSAQDPMRYVTIKPGDPAAKRSNYVNYVQAVPDSLFKLASEDLKKSFAKITPEYPDKVYDIYRLNRFLTPGFLFTDTDEWNASISDFLKEAGPKKQVNLIVVIAKTTDRNYIYALRDAWEGANKNDVVLVIGSADGTTISWVDVISWTKREIFKVQLRDEIFQLGTISRESIMKVVAHQINTNFERRQMKEFSYLENDISPPAWVISLLLALMVITYSAGVFFFLKNNRRGRRFR